MGQGYGPPNSFVAADSETEEEYFEPVRPRGKQQEATPAGLGPPVTTDERMDALPELHRVFVYQFVEEAKKEVDRIKNDRNLSRLFFTESNLREMAIGWTVTLDDMQRVPGINVDAVKKWGRYIIPIVARYSKNYDEAMSGREDRDIDVNHQNVIDLCSDDEEEEFGLGDSEEEAIFQAEQQGSKYFQGAQASGPNNYTRRAPRADSRAGSAGPRRNYRGNGGGSYRGRARGRGGSRRSTGSTSGQSTSGVSKRRATNSSKKAAGSATSKSSTLFKQFGHTQNSGRRGGGSSSGGASRGGGGMGGGGIGMMPT